MRFTASPDWNQWAAPLARIVRARGADAVWTAGLDVLEYPPTWANTPAEIKAVLDAIPAEERKEGSP